MEALESCGDITHWHVESPIQNGQCVNWDQMEHIWHDLLFHELHIKKSRNHSPVLLSVPSTWSREDREYVTKIFFENFNIPGFYLADQPLMSLYGFGQHLTGIVVNFAVDRTEIVPIVDTVIQNHALQVLEYGGQDMRAYLKKMLQSDPHFRSVPATAGPPAITKELLDFFEVEVCELSATPLETEGSKGTKREKDIHKQTFNFKEQQISVGDARLKAAEIWFNPKLIECGSTKTLPEAIFDCLLACDQDRRIPLISNVVLTGPYGRIKGLKLRLEKEVKKFLPATDFCDEYQPKELKFGRMPEYIENLKGQSQHASFLGSAVVAKLVFPDTKNFITKLDYNENGPSVISSKGY